MKNEKAKQQRYDICTKYLSELSSAGSLMELLELHKRMWKEGIQHNNIGPNEYGMFRTKDIASMKPTEVFLGNIYGLWTAPLSDWIGSRDERVIINQYRQHLSSNVDWLRSLVYDNGIDRQKIEKAIAADAPEWAKITDVKVLDKEMRIDKLMEFSYRSDGVLGKSNLLLMTLPGKTDLLFVPKNWHRGEHVPSIYKIDRIGQWKDLGYKDRIVSLSKGLLSRDISVKPINDNESKSQQSRLKR